MYRSILKNSNSENSGILASDSHIPTENHVSERVDYASNPVYPTGYSPYDRWNTTMNSDFYADGQNFIGQNEANMPIFGTDDDLPISNQGSHKQNSGRNSNFNADLLAQAMAAKSKLGLLPDPVDSAKGSAALEALRGYGIDGRSSPTQSTSLVDPYNSSCFSSNQLSSSDHFDELQSLKTGSSRMQEIFAEENLRPLRSILKKAGDFDVTVAATDPGGEISIPSAMSFENIDDEDQYLYGEKVCDQSLTSKKEQLLPEDTSLKSLLELEELSDDDDLDVQLVDKLNFSSSDSSKRASSPSFMQVEQRPVPSKRPTVESVPYSKSELLKPGRSQVCINLKLPATISRKFSEWDEPDIEVVDHFYGPRSDKSSTLSRKSTKTSTAPNSKSETEWVQLKKGATTSGSNESSIDPSELSKYSGVTLRAGFPAQKKLSQGEDFSLEIVEESSSTTTVSRRIEKECFEVSESSGAVSFPFSRSIPFQPTKTVTSTKPESQKSKNSEEHDGNGGDPNTDQLLKASSESTSALKLVPHPLRKTVSSKPVVSGDVCKSGDELSKLKSVSAKDAAIFSKRGNVDTAERSKSRETKEEALEKRRKKMLTLSKEKVSVKSKGSPGYADKTRKDDQIIRAGKEEKLNEKKHSFAFDPYEMGFNKKAHMKTREGDLLSHDKAYNAEDNASRKYSSKRKRSRTPDDYSEEESTSRDPPLGPHSSKREYKYGSGHREQNRFLHEADASRYWKESDPSGYHLDGNVKKRFHESKHKNSISPSRHYQSQSSAEWYHDRSPSREGYVRAQKGWFHHENTDVDPEKYSRRYTRDGSPPKHLHERSSGRHFRSQRHSSESSEGSPVDVSRWRKMASHAFDYDEKHGSRRSRRDCFEISSQRRSREKSKHRRKKSSGRTARKRSQDSLSSEHSSRKSGERTVHSYLREHSPIKEYSIRKSRERGRPRYSQERSPSPIGRSEKKLREKFSMRSKLSSTFVEQSKQRSTDGISGVKQQKNVEPVLAEEIPSKNVEFLSEKEMVPSQCDSAANVVTSLNAFESRPAISQKEELEEFFRRLEKKKRIVSATEAYASQRDMQTINSSRLAAKEHHEMAPYIPQTATSTGQSVVAMTEVSSVYGTPLTYSSAAMEQFSPVAVKTYSPSFSSCAVNYTQSIPQYNPYVAPPAHPQYYHAPQYYMASNAPPLDVPSVRPVTDLPPIMAASDPRSNVPYSDIMVKSPVKAVKKSVARISNLKEVPVVKENISKSPLRSMVSSTETEASKVKPTPGKPEHAKSSDAKPPADALYEKLLAYKKRIHAEIGKHTKEMTRLVKLDEESIRITGKSNEAVRADLESIQSKLQPLLDKARKVSNKMAELKPQGNSQTKTLDASSSSTNVISKVESKVKGEKTDPEVRYFFFDKGNHWCQLCNEVFTTVYQKLEHIASAKHKQLMDPYERPWTAPAKEDPLPRRETGIVKKRLPIKGSEFIIPVEGYYCAICKQCFPDDLHAEHHLKSNDHHEQYTIYAEVNPDYERRYNQSMTAGLNVIEKERKRKAAEEEKAAQSKRRKIREEGENKIKTAEIQDEKDELEELDKEVNGKVKSKGITLHLSGIAKPKPFEEKKIETAASKPEQKVVYIGKAPNYWSRLAAKSEKGSKKKVQKDVSSKGESVEVNPCANKSVTDFSINAKQPSMQAVEPATGIIRSFPKSSSIDANQSSVSSDGKAISGHERSKEAIPTKLSTQDTNSETSLRSDAKVKLEQNTGKSYHPVSRSAEKLSKSVRGKDFPKGAPLQQKGTPLPAKNYAVLAKQTSEVVDENGAKSFRVSAESRKKQTTAHKLATSTEFGKIVTKTAESECCIKEASQITVPLDQVKLPSPLLAKPDIPLPKSVPVAAKAADLALAAQKPSSPVVPLDGKIATPRCTDVTRKAEAKDVIHGPLTEEEQDLLLLGINKEDLTPLAVPKRPPASVVQSPTLVSSESSSTVPVIASNETNTNLSSTVPVVNSSFVPDNTENLSAVAPYNILRPALPPFPPPLQVPPPPVGLVPQAIPSPVSVPGSGEQMFTSNNFIAQTPNVYLVDISSSPTKNSCVSQEVLNKKTEISENLKHFPHSHTSPVTSPPKLDKSTVRDAVVNATSISLEIGGVKSLPEAVPESAGISISKTASNVSDACKKAGNTAVHNHPIQVSLSQNIVCETSKVSSFPACSAVSPNKYETAAVSLNVFSTKPESAGFLKNESVEKLQIDTCHSRGQDIQQVSEIRSQSHNSDSDMGTGHKTFVLPCILQGESAEIQKPTDTSNLVEDRKADEKTEERSFVLRLSETKKSVETALRRNPIKNEETSSFESGVTDAQFTSVQQNEKDLGNNKEHEQLVPIDEQALKCADAPPSVKCGTVDAKSLEVSEDCENGMHQAEVVNIKSDFVFESSPCEGKVCSLPGGTPNSQKYEELQCLEFSNMVVKEKNGKGLNATEMEHVKSNFDNEPVISTIKSGDLDASSKENRVFTDESFSLSSEGGGENQNIATEDVALPPLAEDPSKAISVKFEKALEENISEANISSRSIQLPLSSGSGKEEGKMEGLQQAENEGSLEETASANISEEEISQVEGCNNAGRSNKDIFIFDKAESKNCSLPDSKPSVLVGGIGQQERSVLSIFGDKSNCEVSASDAKKTDVDGIIPGVETAIIGSEQLECRQLQLVEKEPEEQPNVLLLSSSSGTPVTEGGQSAVDIASSIEAEDENSDELDNETPVLVPVIVKESMQLVEGSVFPDSTKKKSFETVADGITIVSGSCKHREAGDGQFSGEDSALQSCAVVSDSVGLLSVHSSEQSVNTDHAVKHSIFSSTLLKEDNGREKVIANPTWVPFISKTCGEEQLINSVCDETDFTSGVAALTADISPDNTSKRGRRKTKGKRKTPVKAGAKVQEIAEEITHLVGRVGQRTRSKRVTGNPKDVLPVSEKIGSRTRSKTSKKTVEVIHLDHDQTGRRTRSKASKQRNKQDEASSSAVVCSEEKAEDIKVIEEKVTVDENINECEAGFVGNSEGQSLTEEQGFPKEKKEDDDTDEYVSDV